MDDQSKSSTSEAASGQIRALVVDDFEINRRVAQLMLRQFGCLADGAGDAREALEMLAREAYHIVFMDCHMPGVDGLEATRLIRQAAGASERATPPSVPVVGLTAFTMTGERERCLAAGMSDYLPKPLEMTSLREVIERWSGVRVVRVKAAEPANSAGPTGRPSLRTSPIRNRLAELLRQIPAESLRQVVQEYISSLGGRLGALRAAIDGGDCAAVARQAHLLLGASLNLGASGLSGLSQVLEKRGNDGCLDGSHELLAMMEVHCRRLVPELQAACDDLAGPAQNSG